MHRPSNVDNPPVLEKLCRVLSEISASLPLIFPVHPRTRASLETAGLMAMLEKAGGMTLTEPLGYADFMNLVMSSRVLITDSGGIQEETTYLGIPCLTLRENTERPVTITQGTNRLCTPETVSGMVDMVIEGNFQEGRVPDLWDGHTAVRVADCIGEISLSD